MRWHEGLLSLSVSAITGLAVMELFTHVATPQGLVGVAFLLQGVVMLFVILAMVWQFTSDAKSRIAVDRLWFAIVTTTSVFLFASLWILAFQTLDTNAMKGSSLRFQQVNIVPMLIGAALFTLLFLWIGRTRKPAI